MRILFVAHGYPPRQAAGTERHVQALVQAAVARGHLVEVIAADRDPARRQYAVRTDLLDGARVHRIVQNVPTRPLAWGESDRSIDRAVGAIAAAFRPDVVHIHHIQFLSSTLPFKSPVVVTLHDQWHWCAAGGLGLTQEGAVCPGPAPERCAPCAAAWRPGPGWLTRVLARTAGILGRVVPPQRLHAAWQAIPTRLRPRPERGVGDEEGEQQAVLRNRKMLDLLHRAHTVVSPSQWLADRCEAVAGIRPIVVRHGVDKAWLARSEASRHGVVFIGTVAAHKGPDRAVSAWRRACPEGRPPLRVHGPVQDVDLLQGHPAAGPLDHAGVRDALDRAQVLVAPSQWPENAPLIVLEARARGCPVVATDIGGTREILQHGRDGRLVPPGDVAALSTAIRELLQSPPTPAAPPDWDTQADRLIELLRQAAAGAP